MRAVLLGAADGYDDCGLAGSDLPGQLGPGEIVDEYRNRGLRECSCAREEREQQDSNRRGSHWRILGDRWRSPQARCLVSLTEMVDEHFRHDAPLARDSGRRGRGEGEPAVGANSFARAASSTSTA